MKSRWNTVLLLLTPAIVLFASILIINTLRLTAKQIQVEPIQIPTADEGDVATGLAQALRYQTVSYQAVTLHLKRSRLARRLGK
jgi:hypothetical protein